LLSDAHTLLFLQIAQFFVKCDCLVHRGGERFVDGIAQLLPVLADLTNNLQFISQRRQKRLQQVFIDCYRIIRSSL